MLTASLIKKGYSVKQKYQSLVHSTIPVSKAIGWSIESLDTHNIKALVRLEPNINIHGTGFAGSIYAAAMATGWTLLKCWYQENAFDAELVAAEANIEYSAPVTEDFYCLATIDQTQPQYDKLMQRLSQPKSCSYQLSVKVECGAKVCAILKIQFVFKC